LAARWANEIPPLARRHLHGQGRPGRPWPCSIARRSASCSSKAPLCGRARRVRLGARARHARLRAPGIAAHAAVRRCVPSARDRRALRPARPASHKPREQWWPFGAPCRRRWKPTGLLHVPSRSGARPSRDRAFAAPARWTGVFCAVRAPESLRMQLPRFGATYRRRKKTELNFSRSVAELPPVTRAEIAAAGGDCSRHEHGAVQFGTLCRRRRKRAALPCVARPRRLSCLDRDYGACRRSNSLRVRRSLGSWR
jgi:hypothetical protein